MNTGWPRFESHPLRMEAMYLRGLFRRGVVLPALAIGSPEMPVSSPQKIEQHRIAMVIEFR